MRYFSINSGLHEGLIIGDACKVPYNEVTRVFLDAFLEKHHNENSVFSPLSIITLLSIVADATAGRANQEVLAFLTAGGPDVDETCEALRMVRETIESSPDVTIANAVAVNEENREKITADFKQKLKRNYGGQLIISSDLINAVNCWVAQKTKGRIRNIVDETQSGAPAFLLNAVTFDAKWETAFTEDDLWGEHFTDFRGRQSTIPMLHRMEKCFLENEQFTGFAMPYKGGNFDFVALLPKEKGPDAFQEAISCINLSGLYQSRVEENVFISMPEFRCSFEENLSAICHELGISTVFTEYADFSPFAKERLMLGEILHKAYIEVDRKGTRAAAATRAEVFYGSAPRLDYKVVKLDQPFVYAVVHRATALPAFVGITTWCEGPKDREK